MQIIEFFLNIASTKQRFNSEVNFHIHFEQQISAAGP